MTVAELIEALRAMPADAVCVGGTVCSEPIEGPLIATMLDGKPAVYL